MPTIQAEEVVVENFVKKALNTIKPSIQRYFAHASGQALSWYTIATHDLSKWESGAAAAGTLALTSAIKRINAWLDK